MVRGDCAQPYDGCGVCEDCIRDDLHEALADVDRLNDRVTKLEGQVAELLPLAIGGLANCLYDDPWVETDEEANRRLELADWCEARWVADTTDEPTAVRVADRVRAGEYGQVAQ